MTLIEVGIKFLIYKAGVKPSVSSWLWLSEALEN